jgi:hypothetical protein
MKSSLSLFLLFFSIFIFCQIKVTGKVSDKNLKPVEGAIVQVLDSNGKTLAYGNSDSNGNFNFQVTKEASYTIEINKISFQPLKKEITINSDQTSIYSEVTLSEKITQIEEVKIIGKSSALKQDGDTLTYKTKYFTTGSERNLKDVLNKLPGFEVGSDGQIKVNGKKVDNLLVDGKEFFGDNHQLATENLDSDMIDDIAVINHYSDNAKIKDLEPSDKTAVNIGIKKEYKGKITGNVSAVSAYEGRYKIGANLFKFDKATNMSFIANSNSINDEVITFEQYFQMILSSKNDFVSKRNSSGSDVLMPVTLLSDDKMTKKYNNFGALNLTSYLSKKTKLNLYSIFNNVDQKRNILNNTSFFDQNSSYNTSENIRTKENLFFNRTRANVDYLVSDNSLLTYSLAFDPYNAEKNSQIDQTYGNIERTINQETKDSPFTLSHQLSYTSKLSPKKLLAFYIFNDINHQKNDYQLDSFPNILNVDSPLLQDKKYNQETYGFLSTYTFKPKRLIYYIGLGYTSVQEKFSSSIENSIYSNNSQFSRNFYSADFNIYKRKGFFQFSLQNTLLYYASLDKVLYLPKANIKFLLDKLSELNFSYQAKNDFAGANQIFTQSILEDYNRVQKDNILNASLPMRSHNWSAYLRYLSLYSGTILNVSFNYIKNEKSIITSSQLFPQYTAISQILNSTPLQSWNININFDKKIDFIKAKIKLNGTYSKSNSLNIIDQLENPINSENILVKASLMSVFKTGIFNYELGISKLTNNSRYISLNKKNTNERTELFINIEGVIKKDFKYYFNNRYYIYTSDQKQHFLKTDFELEYDYSKKWQYSIIGNDILNFNKTQIVSSILQNTMLQTSTTQRLPGYIGMKVKYNL